MAVPADAQNKQQFELPVNADNKSTEFNPFKNTAGGIIPIGWGKSKHTNPHMRGFWFATFGFMFAFIGWFALAPMSPVLRISLGLCANDAEIKEMMEANPDLGDADIKCECDAACKKVFYHAKISSIAFDVFVRFSLGGILEQFGPVATQSTLMGMASIFVFSSMAIQNGTGLIIMRALIGLCGATFVISQFWSSILFAPNVVGTVNATAGGWGNLGGGITQVLIPAVYRAFRSTTSMNTAWRLALLVPGTLFMSISILVRFLAKDLPTEDGKFDIKLLGKKKVDQKKAYAEAFADYRVVLMIFQYSSSFGTELVMNNFLAGHFYDYFGVPLVAAGGLALGFGGMNLFARTLGGVLSDYWAKKWFMRGRLWAHFIATAGSAAGCLALGLVEDHMGWPLALLMVIIFSLFINMAEGTSYGIVPFMQPQNLGVVSGVVGAGGTAGGVICTASFYGPDTHPLTSLKLHAAYIAVAALTCFLLHWPQFGSMFTAPTVAEDKSAGMSSDKAAELAETENKADAAAEPAASA